MQLNGLIDGLIGVPLNVGKDFQIVTVSLDPNETTDKANATKARYLKEYGRQGAEQGWHFLTAHQTGDDTNIRALAASVGFGYQYLPETKEYSHSAAFMMVTPDGRISHYLYGVKFESETLRLSVTQASEGKVGSIMDQVILFCFKYDPKTGQYGFAAIVLLKGGVILAVLILAVWLGLAFRRESRKKNARVAQSVAVAADSSGGVVGMGVITKK
jgi:protein SCO1/2